MLVLVLVIVIEGNRSRSAVRNYVGGWTEGSRLRDYEVDYERDDEHEHDSQVGS